MPTTEVTLALPADWDGPLGVGMGAVGTAFTLMAGIALASGGFYIVNTM